MVTRALPSAASLRFVRLALVYLALVASALLLQGALGWAAGGVLFVYGAVCVLLSAALVGTGSETRWVVGRHGKLLSRDTSGEAVESRREGIARGMGVFAFGLALWAGVFLVD